MNGTTAGPTGKISKLIHALIKHGTLPNMPIPDLIRDAQVELAEKDLEIALLKTRIGELETLKELSYFKGAKEGVTRFAWWRDGEQYVGTSGMTLKTALEQIDDEWKQFQERMQK